MVTGSQTPRPKIDLKDYMAYEHEKPELSWIMAGICFI